MFESCHSDLSENLEIVCRIDKCYQIGQMILVYFFANRIYFL